MDQSLTSISNLKEKKPARSNSKIILRIVFTVLLLSTILTVLYYLHLRHQFDVQQSEMRTRDERHLEMLYEQSEQQLRYLYNVISAIENVRQALSNNDTGTLSDTFRHHWENMQFEWNLDYTGFYSTSSQLMAKWSSRQVDPALNDQIGQWVQQVNQTDQAIDVISCIRICSHYLISPLGRDDMTKAVLVVSTSLLEILDQYRLSTGKIIGLLTPTLDAESSSNMLAKKWGHSLYSLTEAGKYESVLHKFSDLVKPVNGLKKTSVSEVNERHYELNFFPLERSDNGFLIILNDLTYNINQLERQTAQFALVTFFLLLIMQLLLYFPMSRQISRQTEQQATDGEDITVKENKQYEITHTNTPIDFDLTSNPLLSDADRLIQLKKYNQDINEELAGQMISLSHERDLVREILDNTQAIILTLQKDGSILSINKFGQAITGFSEQELKGKNFIDLYSDNMPFALNDLQTMSTIANGEQESYRHEASLSCKDKNERVILWLHSRLNTEHDSDASILSAGLDITEHKQLEKKLSWLADHDSLTTLYNRRRFEEELEEALLWAGKHQVHGALLYIDLDNFKDINDTGGHQVGDIILIKVANTLSRLTAELDSSAHQITARIGGDEFSIILRNLDEESIYILSRRLLDALYQVRHIQDNIRFQLSGSIGIATFPGAESNATELLSNADFAMYQAKLLGRNQYYLFKHEDSYRQQSHARIIWREKIETALREGRFILHYQPILDIQQRSIAHYETLIRLLDENDNLVSPDVFINIAERLGLIQDIDNFIINYAIKKQGELLRQGHDITLSINLSGKVFDAPDLYDTIKKAINDHQARPEKLIFEITETTAVSDIIAAEKIMCKIQSLGCQFALDDFGVGFSSFYYLRELPVDYVKIDGSFVKDLANNTDNKILVKALSEVAIGFNKLTVAEFVDSLQTLHILQNLKVNFAQGYFIGKPSEKIPVETAIFYQTTLED